MSKILIISPETYPKVKVGGLGKVTAGLKKGLLKKGVEVKMVEAEENIYSSLAKKETEIKNRQLGKKALELCDEKWQPDFLWCHDWGGVWSADEFRKYNKKAKIVWTVHSPMSLDAYGAYAYENYEDKDKPVDWGDSFFDFSSLVKTGIALADKLTTVSRTYAKELSRMELFSKKEVLGVGLGLDLSVWNAQSDNLIERRLKNGFDWGNFKQINREKVRSLFSLEESEGPLFVFVSRLVSQKGLGLLLEVLPEFLRQSKAQFVFLGDGREEYKEKLRKLVKKFPKQLAVKLEADFDLPHQIYAGADFLVLPSIAEPFGLVVAEAKRYGVIPVVHRVGGLADQVSDGVNGFGFERYDSLALMRKLMGAVLSFGSGWQEALRSQLAKEVKSEEAMCQDFLNLLYGK